MRACADSAAAACGGRCSTLPRAALARLRERTTCAGSKIRATRTRSSSAISCAARSCRASRERWPEADSAIAHSAAWARAAAGFHRQRGAQGARRACRDSIRRRLLGADGWSCPMRCAIRVLRLLAARPRRWTSRRSSRSPSSSANCAKPARIACPACAWRSAEVRRYRDLLYAMPPAPTPPGLEAECTAQRSRCLPSGASSCLVRPATNVRSSPLHVRYRRGGERFKPAGGAHTRELRLLLQEAGIPPWQRARIPLICARATNCSRSAISGSSDAGRNCCAASDCAALARRIVLHSRTDRRLIPAGALR